MLRRRSASLLFWVKFICFAEDSLSCAMVVMCTGTSFSFCCSAADTHRSSNRFFSNGVSFSPMFLGVTVLCSLFSVVWCIRASIVLCPSEGVSMMNTHSSTKSIFQGLFDWDLLYKHFEPLCGRSPLFSLLNIPSWWRRQLHVVCFILYV